MALAAAAAVSPPALARPVAARVSNPPRLPGKRLALKVRGLSGRVEVLASADRKRSRGDQTIAAHARVRGGKLSVAVPANLRPGSWFVLVCSRHGRCAASKRPFEKRPGHLGKPVSGNPRLETGRAVSATIGTAGGSLDATSENGTKFHLEIAAGSVPNGTTVTMTPLAALEGAGWAGKFVGGVQLGPEGLFLVHGGTLTVTPSHKVPLSHQVAVGYTGGGEALHRVPIGPEAKSVEIPLAHFSGVGLGDSATPPAPPPPSTDVQFGEEMVAGVSQEWREGTISEDEWKSTEHSILEEMRKAIEADEVPPGRSDDGAAEAAIRSLLTYAHDDALVTGNEFGFDGIKPIVLQLLEGIYNRAQERCASQHDLTQIKKIVETDHNLVLLGGTERLEEDLKCARFRVEFDSLIEIHALEGTGDIRLEYTATVTVKPDPAQGLLTIDGSTAGSYKTVSGSETGPDGTSVTALSGIPSTFEVANLILHIGEPAAPSIVIAPHEPMERYHAHDPEGEDFDYEDSLWLKTFAGAFHGADAVGGLVALPLERGSGELFARGSWNTTDPDGGASEATTIDVFHTPG